MDSGSSVVAAKDSAKALKERGAYLAELAERARTDVEMASVELSTLAGGIEAAQARLSNGGLEPGHADRLNQTVLLLRNTMRERQETMTGLVEAAEGIRTERARVDAAAGEVAKRLEELEKRARAAREEGAVAQAAYVIAEGSLRQPVNGSLSSTFGSRFDPYYHRWQIHEGIDLAAGYGEPITAAAKGVVTRAGWNGGYGNFTCIDHGKFEGQRVTTCYAHQSEISVAVGDEVAAGTEIGRVGSTGASTGPHLHFEVRVAGQAVDPTSWLS